MSPLEVILARARNAVDAAKDLRTPTASREGLPSPIVDLSPSRGDLFHFQSDALRDAAEERTAVIAAKAFVDMIVADEEISSASLPSTSSSRSPPEPTPSSSSSLPADISDDWRELLKEDERRKAEIAMGLEGEVEKAQRRAREHHVLWDLDPDVVEADLAEEVAAAAECREEEVAREREWQEDQARAREVAAWRAAEEEAQVRAIAEAERRERAAEEFNALKAAAEATKKNTTAHVIEEAQSMLAEASLTAADELAAVPPSPAVGAGAELDGPALAAFAPASPVSPVESSGVGLEQRSSGAAELDVPAPVPVEEPQASVPAPNAEAVAVPTPVPVEEPQASVPAPDAEAVAVPTPVQEPALASPVPALAPAPAPSSTPTEVGPPTPPTPDDILVVSAAARAAREAEGAAQRAKEEAREAARRAWEEELARESQLMAAERRLSEDPSTAPATATASPARSPAPSPITQSPAASGGASTPAPASPLLLGSAGPALTPAEAEKDAKQRLWEEELESARLAMAEGAPPPAAPGYDPANDIAAAAATAAAAEKEAAAKRAKAAAVRKAKEDAKLKIEAEKKAKMEAARLAREEAEQARREKQLKKEEELLERRLKAEEDRAAKAASKRAHEEERAAKLAASRADAAKSPSHSPEPEPSSSRASAPAPGERTTAGRPAEKKKSSSPEKKKTSPESEAKKAADAEQKLAKAAAAGAAAALREEERRVRAETVRVTKARADIERKAKAEADAKEAAERRAVRVVEKKARAEAEEAERRLKADAVKRAKLDSAKARADAKAEAPRAKVARAAGGAAEAPRAKVARAAGGALAAAGGDDLTFEVVEGRGYKTPSPPKPPPCAAAPPPAPAAVPLVDTSARVPSPRDSRWSDDYDTTDNFLSMEEEVLREESERLDETRLAAAVHHAAAGFPQGVDKDGEEAVTEGSLAETDAASEASVAFAEAKAAAEAEEVAAARVEAEARAAAEAEAAMKAKAAAEAEEAAAARVEAEARAAAEAEEAKAVAAPEVPEDEEQDEQTKFMQELALLRQARLDAEASMSLMRADSLEEAKAEETKAVVPKAVVPKAVVPKAGAVPVRADAVGVEAMVVKEEAQPPPISSTTRRADILGIKPHVNEPPTAAKPVIPPLRLEGIAPPSLSPSPEVDANTLGPNGLPVALEWQPRTNPLRVPGRPRPVLSKKSTAVEAVRGMRIEGRTAVITLAGVAEGSSSAGMSVGLEAACALAEAGCRLVLCARTPAEGQFAKDAVLRRAMAAAQRTGAMPPEIRTMVVDLRSLHSVKELALEHLDSLPVIDFLIHAAEVKGLEALTMSEEGVEMHFAVNHLAPYVLTNFLLPKLELAAKAAQMGVYGSDDEGPFGSRVVFCTSHAQRASDGTFLADVNFERRKYDAAKAYAGSKLANVMYAYQLGRSVMDLGVQAFSVSPGEVSGAGAGKGLKGKLMGGISKMAHRTPENGAASIVYATLAPELSDWSGAYVEDCARAEPGAAAANPSTIDHLWELSEAMVEEWGASLLEGEEKG